jgi:hypothetical protein
MLIVVGDPGDGLRVIGDTVAYEKVAAGLAKAVFREKGGASELIEFSEGAQDRLTRRQIS